MSGFAKEVCASLVNFASYQPPIEGGSLLPARKHAKAAVVSMFNKIKDLNDVQMKLHTDVLGEAMRHRFALDPPEQQVVEQLYGKCVAAGGIVTVGDAVPKSETSELKKSKSQAEIPFDAAANLFAESDSDSSSDS